jgi:hypothetical protein
MKTTLASLLATLFLLGACALASAQQTRLVGTLKNIDLDGPGCSFGFPKGGVIFFDSGSGDTWMNIDGRNVRLSLVKETRPKGRTRVGSRTIKKYSAGDITIDMVEVLTKLSSISNFSATFTVRKGNRTQVVRATGICGD